MLIETMALFCCGTFFGAAIYISIAQHPAALEAGVAVGGKFFPPMYKRAAPMQVTLALLGSISGAILWYQESETLWLIGASLLFSVVPITLIIIKPVNDILLNPDNVADSSETETLLKRWGPKHALRTVVSGMSFILYLFVALNT
ncbi:DUF1772 domain-containing protein [Alteromonadaceae bacterium M269]|nr:DUF1772 domain-containing protein [Alteromonadaceae bacterium M269]